MTKKELQISALERLRKFISTNPEKVNEIVDKHIHSDMNGPSYEEYLSSINESSVLAELNIEYIVADLIFEDDGSFVISTIVQKPISDPPPLIKKRKIKKDSVDHRVFFFVIIATC